MMILLDGHSLTAAEKFMPERMALQLSERGSTATMTLSDAAPVLSVDDWLQAEHGPAAGIVWRVKTIDTQFDKNTRTVTLEHAINTLRDQLMFGEVKSSDISGSSADPTAAQAVAYILNRQSNWTLGGIEYNVSNPYSFNGDDLFSAMETVSGSLENCIWEYDFSVYPFKLYIRQLSSTVCSEMRTDRNIRTLKKTIDRSRMYTRIYPIGKNNIHIDTEYLSKNENLYGTVSRTETDVSQDTKAKLQAWAQERLDRHCEPLVTVTISGLDLEEATGEPLDTFTIGKMCRVPLPEFSTQITERVTKLSYPDVVSTPMDVTVTLANELQDVQTILKQQNASSRRAGRAGAKNNEEDHAWFVDTTDKVAMVAEAVAGKDGDGNPDWSRVAELTVDGNGIDARVVHAEGEIVDAWSAIHATESAIVLEVANAVSSMQSSIEQTASGIRSDVSAANSAIYSYVEQTASGITSVIESTESGLYNYTQQTASGLRQTIISTTNRTWIQDNDPTTAAGGSHTPKTGDVWVESTHQGTWDGADGFEWGWDEQYQWFAIQGAKIWGWANDKWELVSDQQQTITYSDLVNTADYLISLKIQGLINDEGLLDVYLSKLEQTATEIRAEVSRADSAIYSYIVQTASSINLGVGARPTAVIQTSQPTTISGRPPTDNDIWIESQFQDDWNAALDFNWNDDYEINWNELRSDRIYIYKDGEWHLVSDGTVLAEDADLQIDRSQIALLARNIDTLDGYAQENFAALRVRANEISAKVDNRTNELGSSIVQTASQIRSEVHAANSQIYSSITQTASSIHLEVVSAVSSLQSSITQTASGIRTDVSAANSAIYSYIVQTASGIQTSVVNTTSSLRSLITQNADKISLVVSGTGSNASIKTASIVAAINSSGSTVSINADKVKISGTTYLNNVMTVIDTAVGISKPAIFTDNVNINSGGTLTVYDFKLQGTAPVSLDAITMAKAIKDASVSGNTLTLTRFNNETVTFNRAITSWSSGWSNGILTITANPQSQTRKIGFGKSYGTDDFDFEVSQGSDSASKSTTAGKISVPVAVNQLTGASSPPTQRYLKSLDVTVSHLLQEKTATSNGSVTPGSNYIGLSKVTVNITPSLIHAWGGSVLTVSSSPSPSANKTFGFGTNYGAHTQDFEIVTNGSSSKGTGSTVNVPITLNQLNGQSAPTSRYTKSLNVSVSSLLQSKTVQTNGDVTPDSGYIGLSKVSVQVPSGGTIDIPTTQIYTTDREPTSYTKLTTMKTRILQAIDDYEFLVFRVDCGDSQKYYYMDFS